MYIFIYTQIRKHTHALARVHTHTHTHTHTQNQELSKSLEDYARAHVQAIEDTTVDGKPSKPIRNLRESMRLSGLYNDKVCDNSLSVF